MMARTYRIRLLRQFDLSPKLYQSLGPFITAKVVRDIAENTRDGLMGARGD